MTMILIILSIKGFLTLREFLAITIYEWNNELKVVARYRKMAQPGVLVIVKII